MKQRLLAICTSCAFALAANAQEAISDAVVVRADRLPPADENRPFSLVLIPEQTIRAAPQARLDDLLRQQVPGFSLFRRSSSRVANPTTQGVTLRNFGPSGAGRTLVLLDGIPLNDPFAGYLQWNQVPPSAIETVLVTPGGGAGLFGNAALAGTIHLQSRSENESTAAATASVGNTETYSGSVTAALVQKSATLSFFGEAFTTGGHQVLQANQRGPIDRNATADSYVLQFGSAFELSADSSFQLQLRHFGEERGNGTAYTRNDTAGEDVSAAFVQRFPQQNAELRIVGYGQRREYRSTFSAVNASRTIETPSLDQFSVPADSAGGSVVLAFRANEQHAFTIGGDTRCVAGATNELFRFVGGDFTQIREAGGQQLFVGAFAEEVWTPTPAVDVVGSVRADYWQLYDGFRRERERATGRQLLSTAFDDRSGWSINGRIGSSVKVAQALDVRAAFYSGFRVPTLNELYRPFRVGNVTTEANATLDPERLLGGEAGIEWQPISTLRIVATGFYNHLEDAVGNVTIGSGPGGVVVRQRQNIELVTAPGAELTLLWTPNESLRLRSGYIFTHPTVRRAAEPSLQGNLLAQSPQHVATAGVEWRPTAKVLLVAQARYVGAQFEDDQNSATLAPFAVIDAAISYDLTDKISAAAKVENLLDHEIETGKSPDGLVSIGAPRLVTLELRWRL